MKLNVLVVALAALMFGACKGKAKIEASYDIGFQEPSTPPPQTVRVVVEVVGVSQPAAPVRSAPVVHQRQQLVVTPASDCGNPCLQFQASETIKVID